MSETTSVDPVAEDEPVTVADKPREPTPYEIKLRKEAAGVRAKLRETEAKAASDLAEATAAAERRITEATRTANDRIVRAELKAAAISAGMVDLDGLKMLDVSAVTVGEAGDVVIPAGFFDAAKAAKPYLFGAVKTGSTATPPSSAPTQPKRATDMTADEYKAAKAALTKR